MKIKTNETEQFRPIEITITIESEDELETLWHRLNTPEGIVRENTKIINGKNIVVKNEYSLFEAINKLAIQYGVRK